MNIYRALLPISFIAFLLASGLLLAQPPDPGPPKQVLIDARLVVVEQETGREYGFDMLGSVWGRSQPKVGEQVWEGKHEFISFLVSNEDGVFFANALKQDMRFGDSFIEVTGGAERRKLLIRRARLAAVHQRSKSVLVSLKLSAEFRLRWERVGDR